MHPTKLAGMTGAHPATNDLHLTVATGRRSQQRLQGKVALVVGGDAAFGRRMARGLAEKGADVALVCTDEAVPVGGTLLDLAGRRLLLLGRQDAVRPLVALVKEVFGRLDILIDYSARAEESDRDHLPGDPEPDFLASLPLLKASLQEMTAH